MAAKRKRSKAKSPHKAQIILICVFLIFYAALIIAEGCGYDPVGWIKSKLEGNYTVPEDRLAVEFIDVGQGDCILIRAGKQSMLIDCGEASEAELVYERLSKYGVKKLDYVVATHPHSDHMGGMSKIILNFSVGEVIMPYLDDGDIPTAKYFEKFLDACERQNVKLTDAEPGRVIKIGDGTAEIIAPLSKDYGNTNNYSVGIILTHGKNDFLFTGDAEASAEEEMLESGRLRPVTVYKAGHHGSDTSSSKKFLEAISPEYAVIMCGKGNSYGHPHKSILNRLEKYTKKIYRTDRVGSVIFESDGVNLDIKTEASNNDNN